MKKLYLSTVLNNYGRWGVLGGISVLDQGIFSGANFIVSVFLARWLSTENYGAYSVSFAVFLFIIGGYIAIVLEPASVLGPARHGEHLSSYLYGLFRIHFLYCVLLSILMLAVGIILKIVVGNDTLADAVLGNGIVLPFTLLIWLVRRTFYIFHIPKIALAGSVVFFFLYVGGIILAQKLEILTVFLTFLLNGVASFLGAIFALYVGRQLFKDVVTDYMKWHDILQEQWEYGKWRASGSVLSVTFGQMQTFFVAGMIGLDAAGALRAMQNFVQPMVQVQTAIESFGLPIVSQEFSSGNLANIKKKTIFISISLLFLSVLYVIFLLLFSKHLVTLLYSGNYLEYINLIPLFGLMSVVVSIAIGFTLSLLAIQKPQYYLIVYSINAPLSLIMTIVLIKHFGMLGAVLSNILPAIVNLVVSLYLYQRWFPR